MSDQPQSFGHHRRIVPGYHYVLFGILTVNLILRIIWAIRTPGWANAWAIVMAVAFILMGWYLRRFANRAQDRVIRLEMQLRLQRLLSPEMAARVDALGVKQLVALRFASDAEMPELIGEVLGGRVTTPKDIKARVVQWNADHLRA